MKDIKNIERLNNITGSYLALSGLKGDQLPDDDIFIQYYKYMLLVQGIGNTEIKYVPNDLLHEMIQTAYTLQQNIDDYINNIPYGVKTTICNIIGGEAKYQDYINSTVDTLDKNMFELLNNYKSKNPTYNSIKIPTLEKQMFKYADVDEFEKAAKLRDKIKATKEYMVQEKEHQL